MLFYREGRN